MLKETVFQTLKKIDAQIIEASVYNDKGIYITDIILKNKELEICKNYRYLLLKRCLKIEITARDATGNWLNGISQVKVKLNLTVKGLPKRKELLIYIHELEKLPPKIIELKEREDAKNSKLNTANYKLNKLSAENELLKDKIAKLKGELTLLKSSTLEKDEQIKKLEDKIMVQNEGKNE